jgi:hypothetical protein
MAASGFRKPFAKALFRLSVNFAKEANLYVFFTFFGTRKQAN